MGKKQNRQAPARLGDVKEAVESMKEKASTRRSKEYILASTMEK